MNKKLRPSQIRREERARRILSLAEKYAENFGTKLDLYMYIGQQVGCSHITVYKTIKEAEQ